MKLYQKITLLVCALALGIGSMTTYIASQLMSDALLQRFEYEGEFIGQSLSETLVMRVVSDEVVPVLDSLRKVVSENDHIDYMFITDFDKQLFAHSFSGGFPTALIPKLSPNHTQERISRYETSEGLIIHFSRPLIVGMNARLHIGINDNITQTQITELSITLLITAVGIMLIATLAGGLLSRRVSRPLSHLTQLMQAYGRGEPISPKLFKLTSGDYEVANLYNAFSTMVTELEQSMEKVRASEHSLSEAQRIAHLGNWNWDIRSNTLYWSDEIYRIFGLSHRKFDASYDAFLNSVHPDDRSLVVDAVNQAIGKENKPYSVDHRIVLSDGSIRIVHEHAEVLRDADNEAIHMVGTVQDITERKLAEQELEQHRLHLEELVEERTATIKQQARIIDQTHDSIVTADLKGYITSWNSGAERLFGSPADDAVGQHISLFYPKHQHEFLQNEVIEPLKKKGMHETEVQMLRTDGSEFPAHLSLSLLYDNDGAPSGMAGYSIDISELKQGQAELKLLSERLHTINQELEAFSYSVSHDLRTPLRAIDGFSLALLEDYEDKLDDTGRNYLKRVRKGAQKMAKLIDDLLQLSRVTRKELKFQAVDLTRLAQTVVSELRDAAPDREIDVTIVAELKVQGDATLLEVLLANLIGNAWKFTREQPQPSIEIGRTLSDGQEVFFIRDNGAGFDMKYAGKLFGSFQRLHSVEQFEGTGIGLATAQRIINKHGGRIWAEGETGKGATFYFSLPKNTHITKL